MGWPRFVKVLFFFVLADLAICLVVFGVDLFRDVIFGGARGGSAGAPPCWRRPASSESAGAPGLPHGRGRRHPGRSPSREAGTDRRRRSRGPPPRRSGRAGSRVLGRRPHRGSATALALWLDTVDFDQLAAAADSSPALERIYLSSTLLTPAPPSGPGSLHRGLRERIRLIHPFALASELEPAVFQDRSWLPSRGLELTNERLQLPTARSSRDPLDRALNDGARSRSFIQASHSALARGRDPRPAGSRAHASP